MIGLFCKAVFAVVLFSSPGLFNQFIKWRPVLKKKRIGLSGKTGNIPVTLYTREKVKTRPVFVYIAGVRSYHNKHRKLNTLAKALAAIGYHVIVVDDKACTDIRFSGNQRNILGELIDAVYQNELFDNECIVLGGSDYSSRFLFSLLSDWVIVQKVRCLLFLSPVVNIDAMVRFAFTGRVKLDGRWIYRKSSANSRLLHLLNIVEKHTDTGKSDKVTEVFECLLENRKAEAFGIAQNLDPETRNLILSVYRGNMNEDDIRDIINTDNRCLEKMFLPSVPRTDVERPVFIIHDILDEDVDCGQSQRLTEVLSSSFGVYLHLTDFITPDGSRSFYLNPVRWIKGAFRLAKTLYKILSFVYSYKNYSYNPTKTAVRITE